MEELKEGEAKIMGITKKEHSIEVEVVAKINGNLHQTTLIFQKGETSEMIKKHIIAWMKKIRQETEPDIQEGEKLSI